MVPEVFQYYNVYLKSCVDPKKEDKEKESKKKEKEPPNIENALGMADILKSLLAFSKETLASESKKLESNKNSKNPSKSIPPAEKKKYAARKRKREDDAEGDAKGKAASPKKPRKKE